VYIIYKTTNLLDGMFYVGQHVQKDSGFDGYFGSGVYLNKAINKYGEENFVRETLEFCTSSCLNEREIYWIKELSSYNPEYPNRGYNLTRGGDGCRGYIFTDEVKKKMSLNHRGNQSEKSRRLIGQKNKIKLKGLKRTKEFKEKVRLGMIGINKGKIHSDETNFKNKIGHQKYSYLLISPNGEEFNVNFLRDFCEQHNLNYSSVDTMFRLKKKFYKGWKIKRRLKWLK